MAIISKKQFERLIDKHQHYIDKDTDNWRSCKAVVTDKGVGEMVIKDANLSHSEFEFTYFERVSFVGVYFSKSIFTDCEFDECQFVGCTFDSVFFSNINFHKCVFTGSNFALCTFDNCSIKYSIVMNDDIAKDLGVDPAIYFPIKVSSNRFYLCEFTAAFAERTDFLKNTLDDCRFYACDFSLLMWVFDHGIMKLMDNRSSFRNCYFAPNCENIPDLPLACPSTGSFTAYKKVNVLYNRCPRTKNNIGSYAIAVLQIPASAKRSSANGNKCRCDKAKVIRFETIEGKKISNPEIYIFTSIHDLYFDYEVGKTVKPTSEFCEDRWNECSSGIHFFMNREDAVLY